LFESIETALELAASTVFRFVGALGLLLGISA